MAERRHCRSCNAILASDHTDSLCSPCASRAALGSGAPPVPSSSLWERAAVRAALDNQHVGQLIRAYRQAHAPPITQTTMADWLETTQGHLSIIERQRRPITDLQRLKRWCDTLHVPQHLRWFQASASSRSTAPGDAEVSIDAGADLVSIARLRQRVLELSHRYDQEPSSALLPEAGQLLGRVTALRKGSSPLVKDVRLLEAEAATLMGQLAWDASQRKDHQTASAFFARAARAARDIDDPTAEGYALLRRAYVALYGERDAALGLKLTVQSAHKACRTSNVLSGIARLHSAEAHAMLGAADDCERMLDQAGERLAEAKGADIASHLYRPSQLDRLAGSCYLSLGQHGKARQKLERAATTIGTRSKSGAIVLGNRGLSHLGQGDLEAATLALNHAIDTVDRTRGGGGLNVVANACRQLHPWRSEPRVHDVYDRLLSLMATS